MKVRLTAKPEVTGVSGEFNTHAMSEIIVGFDEGDMDSCYIRDYEVWLESKQEWKSLSQAFKDKDVIPNNFHSRFGEPRTEEDRARGYSD